MSRSAALCLALALLPGAGSAEEPTKKAETGAGGAKVMSGMSIVGNDEAPKSLVIVPWKSSELGGPVDVSRSLDDARQPVDPDVFLRELSYFEIRTGAGTPPAAAAP